MESGMMHSYEYPNFESYAVAVISVPCERAIENPLMEPHWNAEARTLSNRRKVGPWLTYAHAVDTSDGSVRRRRRYT